MVDICMCYNSGYCERASTCFRALATPDEYQTVANFYKCDSCVCDHYWPVKDAEELAKLNKENE